jgi:hypothetical protein
MDAAEESPDGAQAHPFQIEPYRLVALRRTMPLLLRGGSKVA